jgi:hypothetical protein
MGRVGAGGSWFPVECWAGRGEAEEKLEGGIPNVRQPPSPGGGPQPPAAGAPKALLCVGRLERLQAQREAQLVPLAVLHAAQQRRRVALPRRPQRRLQPPHPPAQLLEAGRQPAHHKPAAGLIRPTLRHRKAAGQSPEADCAVQTAADGHMRRSRFEGRAAGGPVRSPVRPLRPVLQVSAVRGLQAAVRRRALALHTHKRVQQRQHARDGGGGGRLLPVLLLPLLAGSAGGR